MNANPTTMGKTGSAGPTTATLAGDGAGTASNALGSLGQLDQLRSALEGITEIVGRPNLVIIRNADSQELWLDILGAGSGESIIPGHTPTIRFGDPPPNASTNPATFFAASVAAWSPLGVPIWIWLAGAAGFFFIVLPMLRKK